MSTTEPPCDPALKREMRVCVQGANACWWYAVLLAFNLQALIGITVLEPELARAGWKRIRAVLLIHAGRLVRRARQWILVLRRAGTEALQKALARLDPVRSPAPG